MGNSASAGILAMTFEKTVQPQIAPIAPIFWGWDLLGRGALTSKLPSSAICELCAACGLENLAAGLVLTLSITNR